MVGGQFKSHMKCVKDPAKDQLSHLPVAVTFQQLLDGCRLLPVRTTVAQVKGVKDLVQGVKKNKSNTVQLRCNCVVSPCLRATMLSTKTSKVARGWHFQRQCGRQRKRLVLVVGKAAGRASCAGANSAWGSSRCGGGLQGVWSCWLVRLVIVSVAAQKYRGNLVQPMGRTGGSAGSGYSPTIVGMETASFGMSSTLTEIW
jgi:hypothetical protein